MVFANLPARALVTNYVQGSQYNYCVHKHYHYHTCQLQPCSATTNEIAPKAQDGLDGNCTHISDSEHHGCHHAASTEGFRETRIAKGRPAANSSSLSVATTSKSSGQMRRECHTQYVSFARSLITLHRRCPGVSASKARGRKEG